MHGKEGMTPSFLRGGGEMSGLICDKDWSDHPLGTPEIWPVAFKISLNNMLKTAFPSLIFWGEDLFCFYNDSYKPILGTDGKHPRILGEKAALAYPEIWETIEPMLMQVITSGKPIWRENQLIPIYRNGRLENVYWTFSYSALMGDDEQVSGVLVTCTETTQAVLSLQRLEESEDLLKFAVDAAELGTWDYNPRTGKFHGNQRLKNWFGISINSEIDLAIALNAILPEDRKRVEKSIQNALDGNNNGKYDIIYRIKNEKNHEIKIVRALGRAWFDSAGEAYRFNGTLQDVTEQEKSAEQLRTANLQIKFEKERFENIVRNAPVGIAMFKGDDILVEMANPTFLNIVDKLSEELIGRKLYEVFPDLTERIKPLFDDVFKNEKAVVGKEFYLPLKRQGSIVHAYFNFILHPTKISSKEDFEIMLIANEITDYVVSQRILNEKENQFKNLVLQSPVAKAIFRGQDLVIEMANHKMLKHFWDKSWKEVAGKKLVEVFPELEGQKYINILKEVISTGETVKDYDSKAVVVKNGVENVFYVNYVYLPLREMDGTVFGVMITVTDVTNEFLAKEKLINFSKELEKQVEQRTSMLNKANIDLKNSIEQLEKANDELESFAYVSSHDLQEPLRKIQMFTSRIIDHDGNNLSSKGKTYFHKITESAKRMRNLINDLLTFSKADNEDYKLENVDLDTMLQFILEDRSEYIESLGALIQRDKLPTIVGIPFQLRQVFDNLIGNALKFSKEGQAPVIDITSEVLAGGEKELEGLKNGIPYVKIKIKDNGIGFPKGMEAKIFEVFQRTHDRTKYGGTGIGLAIVKKIVHAHNGIIKATSVEGHGSVFTLYLPLGTL
ncbi:PAS domain-containing protein [Euzebyella saccharophila]|uniref:histidine kinase n=1 Tax=Euzebyella saccharophila TaxID=679664 RepID=A0ABV8JSE7_9FLAO|nr:PAS domain-containing protein [Euzebyella saccharophila]